MARRSCATMGKASLAVRAAVWTAIVSLGLVGASAATDLYVETAIDPSGQLHITTKHRREIVPKKESHQVGFGSAQISPDERAVGWLALYPDCCSPSPIPLKLVVLASDTQRTFEGNGLPIRRWCFWAGGKQVAFEQETEHGGMAVHYELHDIESGDLIDKYDPDASAETVTKPPKWVVTLDARG